MASRRLTIAGVVELVTREIAQQALRWLASGKIKGKTVKVRLMGVEDDAQAGERSRANAGARRRPQG